MKQPTHSTIGVALTLSTETAQSAHALTEAIERSAKTTTILGARDTPYLMVCGWNNHILPRRSLLLTVVQGRSSWPQDNLIFSPRLDISPDDVVRWRISFSGALHGLGLEIARRTASYESIVPDFFAIPLARLDDSRDRAVVGEIFTNTYARSTGELVIVRTGTYGEVTEVLYRVRAPTPAHI